MWDHPNKKEKKKKEWGQNSHFIALDGKCHDDCIFRILWCSQWHLTVRGVRDGISQVTSYCNGTNKIYSEKKPSKAPERR